jgi:hypothetical protein
MDYKTKQLLKQASKEVFKKFYLRKLASYMLAHEVKKYLKN